MRLSHPCAAQAANANANFAATKSSDSATLALDALGHAVRFAPESAVAHANLGAARRAVGDHAGAALCFAAVHELNPRDGASYFNHAQAMRALDQHAAAAKLFERAADLDARDADAAYMASLLASEAGDYGKEETFLERALTADANHTKALVNRAVLYGEAGDLDAELRLNAQAVAADGNCPVARNALGAALAMRQKLDDALVHFNAVVDSRAYGDDAELARATDLRARVLRILDRQKEQANLANASS